MDARIAASGAYLFAPEPALRVRWDNNPDTPLPPETPAGQNPPDGAILNYYLNSAATGEITLAIYDERGNVVRRFSSNPPPEDLPLPNVPSYWFAPPEALPKNAGVNRFTWDLRYAPPLALPYSYYGQLLEYTEYTLADDAVPGATPRRQPRGPLVVPGNYTVELTVAGQTYRQPLSIKLDPRVKASASDLLEQLELEKAYHRRNGSQLQRLSPGGRFADCALGTAERSRRADSIKGCCRCRESAFDKKIEEIENGMRAAPGLGPVNRDLTRYAFAIGSADIRPSETAHAAVEESCKALDESLARWRTLNDQDLASLNSMLEQHKIAALPVVTGIGSSGMQIAIRHEMRQL